MRKSTSKIKQLDFIQFLKAAWQKDLNKQTFLDSSLPKSDVAKKGARDKRFYRDLHEGKLNKVLNVFVPHEKISSEHDHDDHNASKWKNEVVKTKDYLHENHSRQKPIRRRLEKTLSNPIHHSFFHSVKHDLHELLDHHSYEYLAFKRRARVAAIGLAALIVSIALGVLAPNTTQSALDRVDKLAVYPAKQIAKVTGWLGFEFELVSEPVLVRSLPQNLDKISAEDKSDYIARNSERLQIKLWEGKKRVHVPKESLRGRVAGATAAAVATPVQVEKVNTTSGTGEGDVWVMLKVGLKDIFQKAAAAQKQFSMEMGEKFSGLIDR